MKNLRSLSASCIILLLVTYNSHMTNIIVQVESGILSYSLEIQ
uniref:Uncharacterized protein n=1 Tax=Setaria viridis TaxID=4556 RepID=A0A4U6VM59_SETVI|nr:hypothetical protein SEVIR_2G013350v2 [Setaria viridis]